MKTTICSILSCLLILLVFLTESHAAQEAGEILAVRKSVYLEREGKRETAKPSTPLLRKDKVETDAKSRAKLYFEDDSILNLGEKSGVVVEEYLYNAEKDRTKSVYKLLDGSLKVVVGNSDLEIHTPTALVAARGTRFYVTVTSKEIIPAPGQPPRRVYVTNVFVEEGIVETTNIQDNIGAAVSVHKGESTSVQSMKPPESVHPVNTGATQEVTSQTMVLGHFTEDKLTKNIAPVQAPPAPVTLIQETRDTVQAPIEQQPTESLTPVIFRIVLP